MKDRESSEMYLETVYRLSIKSPTIRSVDIAEELNYSRPSVSRGIRVLQSQGLIELDDKSKITLTAEGKRRAERLYDRHKVLTALLVSYNVPHETAEEDACRIEHVISDESFNAIKNALAKPNGENDVNRSI
ncbi:MAG: metal-dependent transcriptional regulator [Clostridia bacterium]|nr:metal-dependent transcriptional regulator [Clostridia bacterium]